MAAIESKSNVLKIVSYDGESHSDSFTALIDPQLLLVANCLLLLITLTNIKWFAFCEMMCFIASSMLLL